MYKELQGTGCFEWMNLETDEDEHSIEMHLPYIAKVFEKYVNLLQSEFFTCKLLQCCSFSNILLFFLVTEILPLSQFWLDRCLRNVKPTTEDSFPSISRTPTTVSSFHRIFATGVNDFVTPTMTKHAEKFSSLSKG